MRHHRKFWFPTFLYGLIVFSGMIAGVTDVVSAAEPQPSARMEGQFSPEVAQQAPPDTQAIDMALSQALKLFYDKQYVQALPVFMRLEKKIANLDMLFWTGICAANSGEYAIAIDRLQKMLLFSPKLQRVRLELAVAYFKSGDLVKAKEAFTQVKESSPPPNVLKKIDHYLVMIYNQEKTFTHNIRLTQGYQYDTNISSGPGLPMITDGIEDNVVIDADDQKMAAHKWLTDINFNLFIDPGEAGGFMIHNGYRFFNLLNSELDTYNYLNASVFVGPWWTNTRNILKMPLGYTFQHYGTTPLSNNFYITPSAEHFFSPMISIKGEFNFGIEEYIDEEYSESGNNNKTYTFSVGPEIYLDRDRNYMMALNYSHEWHDADTAMHSYETQSGLVSLFSKWSTDTEFYAAYRYTANNYDAPPYNYTDNRRDERHAIDVLLAQNFWTHYFVSLGYDYIQNNSNADLYTFEKNLFSINLGVNL